VRYAEATSLKLFCYHHTVFTITDVCFFLFNFNSFVLRWRCCTP
jgi:hypothetical protein